MKQPTKKQRERWSKIAELGCIICGGQAELHHCGTGFGGRKNHDYVIPLCYEHHRGAYGIDGRQKLSKKQWQKIHGSERSLHEKVKQLLGE